MAISDGVYDIVSGGEPIGTVRVKRAGLFTALECVCSASGPGVKKLWAICGGREINIGVLMPSGGSLRLSKRYSDNDMARIGLKQPERFVISSGTAETGGWSPCRDPWSLFTDDYLKNVCRSVNGALMRRDGEVVYLAVPVSSDAPFPMMPTFCFGEPTEINSREFIAFSIKNGELVT